MASPRGAIYLAGAALLTTVLVCWVTDVEYGVPSELLSTSVSERVSNLESQAKEIENVRQDAKYLDHEIAELEKQGETGKFHEQELKVKAAELRQRLLGLAKKAQITPSRLLTRHDDQSLLRAAAALPHAMPMHRSIDDPHFKGSDFAAAKRGPGAKEIGALAEVEGTKQDQAHFEHRFGGLGARGVEAWEVAPKQNQFGEETHASMHFLNRHHAPSWLYAPAEAADGSDLPPGTKKAKLAAAPGKYLHRYGGHTSSAPSWAYNPKIGAPAWKVSPGAGSDNAAESSSQEAAAGWFKALREGGEAAPSAAIDTHGDVAKHFGKDFSGFRSVLNARMAKELRTLRAADAAVDAMQKQRTEDIGGAGAVAAEEGEGKGGASSPLARSASYLDSLVDAASSKYGSRVQKREGHSLNGEAEALEEALRAAAERAKGRAAHEAALWRAEEGNAEGARGGKGGQQRRASAAWATVEGMEKDLEGVERREEGMSAQERSRLQPDLRQMKAALEGARVTAASEERNERQLQRVQAAAARAGREQAALQARRRAELQPLTKQAVVAERQVKAIAAALAKAKEQAAMAKQREGMSKLDKLGINTGEVHTRWGGDQIV